MNQPKVLQPGDFVRFRNVKKLNLQTILNPRVMLLVKSSFSAAASGPSAFFQ
jgi:hypothetical protein